MDRSSVVSNVQETMTTKKETGKRKSSNKKKQPLKVVYISNPMKVHTSASEFRALVQELTGRDAEFPDPSKFPSAAPVHARQTNLEKQQREGDVTPMEDSNDDDDDDDDDFFKSSYESLEEILRREMAMDNLAPASVESSGLVIGAFM